MGDPQTRARTADRRVITRQSSTGIQFLDDYRQEGRAVGSERNPDSRAEEKEERERERKATKKKKREKDSIAEKTGVEGKEVPVIGETDSSLRTVERTQSRPLVSPGRGISIM